MLIKIEGPEQIVWAGRQGRKKKGVIIDILV